MTPRIVLLIALLPAAPAQAQLCDYYVNCCRQLVGAYQEAGVPAARVEQFAYTCTLQDRLVGFPAAQEMFCEGAWEAISREAFQHFLQRRIGFYPDDCFDLPLEDPEDILIPYEELFPPDVFPDPAPEDAE